MIKRLTGSVTFTTPPITLAVDIQPQNGITAVVGPNGSGKSFAAVELTRYLLFGKAALRGAASDYKTLEARGTFTIRGQDYEIYRGKSEWIAVAGADEVALAVGAKAVTEKVVELMGYGLAVFDIANASVQKKADSFGKMAPVERKRLIDRVVGMTSLEDIEKSCRDEAKMFKREAEALEKVLPQLVPPSKPIVQFSDVIAKELEHAEQYASLSARKRPVQRVEAPSGTLPSPEAVKALEAHQMEAEQRKRQRLQLQSVMNQARIYAPGYTDEQLDAAEERDKIRIELINRGPRPQLSAQTSEWLWAAHALRDAWQPSPETICPNCDHRWHETGTQPPAPNWSKEALRADDAARAAWAAPEPVKPEGPDLTAKQIKDHRASNDADARHDAAWAEHEAIVLLEDKSAELEDLRALQVEWATYSALLRASEQAEAENAAIDEQLEKLGTPPEVTRQELVNAQEAERQWVAYDQSVIRRAELSDQIAEKLRLAEEFRKGGLALSDARTTMKAYLAPAISRAASALITDMTHGKLSSIVVDEDMEITVNGQRIETLSGGGETVANIALRIALGQVLVVDTFPVFIGDEMDADADDERREAVIESLVSLKEHLAQIIVVTHRGIEVADHVIDMKDTE